MGRFLIVLLCLASIFFTCVVSSKAQDAYEPNPAVVRLINEGIRLHKDKDYVGALKSFSEALSVEPNNVLVRENLSIAHNNYGKYLVERTDYEKALQEFRLALYYDQKNKTAELNLDALLNEKGVKAQDPTVRLQLGNKLRENANFELALVEYRKALSLSETPNPDVLIYIGDIYYILYLRDGQKANNINEAVDYYKKALAAKETAKAHVKVGDGLLAYKDVVGALGHYKKAIELEPDSQDAISANVRGWNEAVRLAPLVPENHIGLAAALQYKRDFVNAEEEYSQALKLDPNNQAAKQGLQSLVQDKLRAQAEEHVKLALTLQSQGKNNEAITEYIRAIEVSPNDSKLHYNIGTAFQAINDYDHAKKAYNKALEIDPENQKAKSALELLVKRINDQKVKELSTRAVDLQNSGNYREAVTTYLAAISIDQQSPSLYYNLGTAYQALGDLETAKKQYEKAIELDEGNTTYLSAVKLAVQELASPHIQSAINKQSANDFEGAIIDYLQALKIIPEDAQTHFNLATAYQGANQAENAIAEYKRALLLDPEGQIDALFFLAFLFEEQKNNIEAIKNYEEYIKKASAGTYTKEAKERVEYLKSL